MNAPIRSALTINGRRYDFPTRPAVVICLDGCEPAYLDAAIADGLMPALERLIAGGERTTALSAMPSFTNPNNLSIATGVPSAIHGICGNFFLDPASGEEIMMNDPSFLRAPTVFSAFQQAGARIAVVTAKDKLRGLLGAGLAFDGCAICFSAERADGTTETEHGIVDAAAWLGRPVPPVYSAELSEFVFASGVKLLSEFKPDLMYLTTTDFVQHKYAPGAPEANAFYAMFDRYLTEMVEKGANLVITADHGMKPKHHADGSPDVIYLQDILDKTIDGARVILPITDPYVVHHGAFGAFATVHLPEDADVPSLVTMVTSIEGIDTVLTKAEACARFDLPADRIGDIVVTSVAEKAIGTSPSRHDLSALTEPLRSHGGLGEQSVPFIVSRKGTALPEGLRNYDAVQIAVGMESVCDG